MLALKLFMRLLPSLYTEGVTDSLSLAWGDVTHKVHSTKARMTGHGMRSGLCCFSLDKCGCQIDSTYI